MKIRKAGSRKIGSWTPAKPADPKPNSTDVKAPLNPASKAPAASKSSRKKEG